MTQADVYQRIADELTALADRMHSVHDRELTKLRAANLRRLAQEQRS